MSNTTLPVVPPPAGRSPALAAALVARRRDAAMVMLASVAGWDKLRDEIAAAVGGVDAVLDQHFNAFVDYLALYFRTADPTYLDLYVGEKIKEAYHEPEGSVDAQIDRRRIITDADEKGLLDLFRAELSPPDLDRLRDTLRSVAATLTTRAGRTFEVLFVGDCLFQDVMAFLPGATLGDSVSVNPTFLYSKNPVQLRGDVRKLADRKFDLVFYSPFSYEFAPEVARLMGARFAATGRGKIQALADAAMGHVTGTLDVISDAFECPVYVHNTVNVRRHDSGVVQRGSNLVTWRSRRLAASMVNEKLAAYVAQRNAATHEHVILVDERALAATHGEMALGRMFYDSNFQHPAAMGKAVADVYRDLLAAHAKLVGRKVVVCDLDNTLWAGVIGEGAVTHHADRQRLLKRLQAKGVVLAIASKNDPKNVHWTGGVLSADDFVCAQVNWDNKVTNLRRISQVLNLKTKDFVFVDDRADEREMVRQALPEVAVLDATSPRDWGLLERWADALPAQGETDRTQFYKQKEARESFLDEQGVEDPGLVFDKLGITVDVRRARKSDLKRAVELVNRTNQFNTNASRTTLREMTDQLASGEHQVLIVDAGDKFGTMGTVSIAVVRVGADAVEIPTFVLSCRVFGYGIENVVVNAVKRLAAAKGLPVVGPMRQTPHNDPCRTVYADNDFERDGDGWIYRGTAVPADPTWLRVTHDDATLRAA